MTITLQTKGYPRITMNDDGTQLQLSFKASNEVFHFIVPCPENLFAVNEEKLITFLNFLKLCSLL